MLCSKCGSENPADNNFCARCGNALARLCLKCGAENPPPSSFCGKCGAALSTLVDSLVSEMPPIKPQEIAGERRHLTVLFCDLVGSTAIAAQLDPEEWRATVDAYHGAAAEAITRFGGHVAKYLGDGVMAFFGYPEAHDNDAEPAARAGLAILESITRLNEEAAHPKLSARVGIDSGPVVVGVGAGKDADVFGDTPNIAARVQAAADPGTVLVSANTHRLISGLFIVEDRGAQVLKGIEQPLQLYRVVRPSGVRGRLEAAAASRGLTPFVGREDELRSLMTRWERVLEGEGQVALIVGEAGIGKSRLVHRFHEAIADTPHTWIEVGAGAFFQNTPFYPVTEMLCQFIGNTTAAAQVTQLETRLIAAGLKPAEALPLIAPLLNLPLPTKYPPSALPPEQQRRRLLATLVEWVLGAARAQPLVIATEDLHWVDPSTLELIQLLLEQGAHARLLLVYTARPEFHPPWPLRAHHAQINLNRLNTRDIHAMVAQVAATKALAEDTVAAVVERTGGVPLFVEELTRSLLENGDSKITGRAIPATLHDSLMARLDRLGPAKEVIQIGAVLGSAFSYELLHAVHPIAETDLQQALERLADAELLYVRGLTPDATYQFKHALIRDAAYEALLKSRRKELHRIVAQAIDTRFSELKQTHPEMLARHWTEAGEIEPAIGEWNRAAKSAESRNAFKEALESYQQALAVLKLQPDSPARDSRESALQLELAGVLLVSRGFSAMETAAAYERARLLAERSGGRESLDVFFGLFNTASSRGELGAARALADQLIELSKVFNDPVASLIAHYAAGLSHHYSGDLIEARSHLLQAIDSYREEDFKDNPNDIGVNSLIWIGINESYLGFSDAALRYSDEAISLSRRLNKPFGLAFASTMGALDHAVRGDLERSLECGEETIKLGTLLGFSLFNAIGNIGLAWVHSRMGETSGMANQIREGLAALDSQKFFLARTWNLRLLAEVQALSGQVKEALVSIDEALQANPSELLYLPDVLRVRGELLLNDAGAETSVELAENDFHEAIELARRMNAKSVELRATTSLARLLREAGRGDEARTTLAEIYGWFTEGFDTSDLKDAKVLLEELSGV